MDKRFNLLNEARDPFHEWAAHFLPPETDWLSPREIPPQITQINQLYYQRNALWLGYVSQLALTLTGNVDQLLQRPRDLEIKTNMQSINKYLPAYLYSLDTRVSRDRADYESCLASGTCLSWNLLCPDGAVENAFASH